MIDLILFKIDTINKNTRITNNTEYDVYMSLIPEKPKRKYTDVSVIPSGFYKIYEGLIDISEVSFSFRKKNA